MRSPQGPGAVDAQNSHTPSPSAPRAFFYRFQQMVNADEKGGWDTAWRESETPWDLGDVTPAVSFLIHSGSIDQQAKRVLVPGCGTGYDVLAFSEGGKRTVVGLDISETALAHAREHVRGKPGSECVSFVKADFFVYSPDEPFDLIFDYTFFCALHPRQRQEWAKRTSANLAPHGTLFTLAFPISKHEGGPPYAVSIKQYEEVLNLHGLFCEELHTVSHPSRQGMEKLLKWTRVER